jgi:hypothetical protein
VATKWAKNLLRKTDIRILANSVATAWAAKVIQKLRETSHKGGTVRKRVIIKISLSPGHPAEAELLKRLDTMEDKTKSAHLKLAAFHYFGIIGKLVSVNNPHLKEASSADIGNQQSNDSSIKKGEETLDSSSIFASAFDN